MKNFSDKIFSLNYNETFPLKQIAVQNSFQKLKEGLQDAMSVTTDYI